MQINIEMTDDDFGMLTEDAVWVEDSAHIIDVLEPHDPESGPSLDYAMAYWLEPGWTTVMTAKAFLQAQGVPFDLFYDHEGTDGTGSWVLLTDYVTLENREEGEARDDLARCVVEGHHLDEDALHPYDECPANAHTTKVWRVDYQTTDFERYGTDLNQRVHDALAAVGSITEISGGSDGTTGDTSYTIATTRPAVEISNIVSRVLGEGRPFDLHNAEGLA